MNNHSTRVSPHMARLWQMLNILFTIRSFEMKVAQNEEKIKGCEAGANKYHPHYSLLKQSYMDANLTFRQRIGDEEAAYNQLLNELSLLSIQPSTAGLPELKDKMFDDENSIESQHHRNTCGGH